MNRVPAIVILVVCVTGLFAANTMLDPRPPIMPQPVLLPMPAASGAETLGSTWYCPANLASSDGQYQSTLVVTNPGDAVEGTLTLFPGPVGDSVRTTSTPPIQSEFNVDAGGEVRILVNDELRTTLPAFSIDEVTFAGAVLEFASPGVVVEHVVVSPFGAEMAPCNSQSATAWYSASSTTLNGVDSYLMILNPFAATAVIDITFVSDDGEAYEEGLVVAPQSQLMLDLGQLSRVRAQTAMSITARSGRVAVEKVQLFHRDDGLEGLSLASAVGSPSVQWFFPAGRFSPGGMSYIIYNPNENAAEVEVLVKPVESAEISAASLPLPLTVPAGERVEVVMSEDPSLPTSERALPYGERIDTALPYWVLVQSFNDVPLVVERMVTTTTDDVKGVTVGPGVPAASTEQWLPLPIELGATSPQVSIVNPANDTLARVSVKALLDDDIVEVTSLEIAAGDRVKADLSATLPVGAVSLMLESSAPIASEVTVGAPTAVVATYGVPTADSLAPVRLVVDYGE